MSFRLIPKSVTLNDLERRDVIIWTDFAVLSQLTHLTNGQTDGRTDRPFSRLDRPAFTAPR